MKKILLLFVSLSTILNIEAQTFSEVVTAISGKLQTVENNKSEVSQSITEVQPGVVQLKLISTVLKSGNTTEELYEFNLADVDVNTIRAYTNKDVIQVQLLVGKKQKLIKNTTDNQKISYVDGFDFYAKNIDNGRELVDLFKSLVPLSTEITEKRLSLSGYKQHIDWLEQNVGVVALIDRQYNQKLHANQNYPGRLELKIDESTSKKNNNNVYHFNLANINPNSIVFEIKGDVSIINMETRRKLNTVKTFSDGEQGNYTNSFVIYCESIEKARDLQKVLKEAITLSEKAIDNSIPSISSVKEGVQTINNFIKTVVINDVTYNQSFKGECVVELEKKEVSGSKMTDELLHFNFSDINKNTIKYSTKGKNVFIDFQTTGGHKYIKQTVNGEQKNYANSFRLEFAEVEEAIIAEALFKKIIELCENQKVNYSSSKSELLQQLSGTIKRVQDDKMTYEQTFEDKGDNRIQIKIVEITDKKSTEKIYEFNLRDINPSSVMFQTSSKNVYVTISTNYMEKIIQFYEDGAIKNYQNSIDLQAENIENARTIVNLFKKVLDK
jgi:hypothetical protein